MASDDNHKNDDDDVDDVEQHKKSKSSSSSSSKKKSRKSVDSSTADDKSAAATSTATGGGGAGKTYEERCQAVNVISHPLASKKSTKHIYKLVKKAAASSSGQKHVVVVVRRGVKEVVKGLRKGDRGLAILAGDIYPIDVVSHLPLLLEDYNVPYLFVPSKQDLGAAASTKRPTSCVLIKTPGSTTTTTTTTSKQTKTKEGSSSSNNEKFDGQDLYDALVKEAKEYNPTNI